MQSHLLNLVAKLNATDVHIPKADANTVVDGVLKTVYYAGGIACVIVIIVAGILYTLSSGEPAKITQAKNAIIYAVVGLVLIMMAFIITDFVIGRF